MLNILKRILNMSDESRSRRVESLIEISWLIKKVREEIAEECKNAIEEVLDHNPDFGYYSECDQTEEEYKKEQLEDILKIIRGDYEC